MRIVDDSPPVLTALDRPNSYIGRAVPRPNLTRLTEGRGQYVSDVTLPRMAHVAYLRSPHAHARIVSIDTAAAKQARRRDRGRHRRGARQGDHAVGRRADASQGHQVGAAIRHRGRARLLAGRGGVRRGGEDARAGRGCVRAGRGEVRGASRRHRRRDRTGCRHAGDPSGAWRQSHLRAQARGGRAGQGLRRGRRGDRGDVPVRPPHRRVQRAARGRGRLESRRAAPDRLSRHAGAAHDAEPVRQASRAGRAAGARHHQGRRRLVRHQGAHLCGRDGDGRAVEAAAAPGEVRRRPAGKLRHRHPCARSSRQGEDRREAGRHDHRLGDRRSHRHRAVLGLSAHLAASRRTRS